MGSPGLKESFEAHLSDVLNDMPVDENDNDNNAPLSGGCNQVDKKATEANYTAVKENGAAELNVPIVGMDKVAPPPSPSSFAPPSVSLVQEDSQNSIIDIEGFGDDEDEVSLMDWSAQQDGKVPPSSQAACDSAPEQRGGIIEGDALKDRHEQRYTEITGSSR